MRQTDLITDYDIMRYLTIILTALFLCVSSNLQADEFNKAIKNVKEKRVRKKLKRFKAEGIEKKLKTKGITPDMLVKAAKKYKGIKHCMGGNGSYNKRQKKRCIDCSGLLYVSLHDAGVKIKARSSQEIARYGKIISKKRNLKKGDLVFFVKTYKPKDKRKVITHSGIMINKKEWIHTSSKRGVITESLDSPYWNDKFVFGTRIF